MLSPPRPAAPDQVWVGDSTCLPKQGGGWLYLASGQDTCSRKVVGWDARESMPEDLVSEALRRALVVGPPAAGLIVHAEQGSQYTATRFCQPAGSPRRDAEHEPTRHLL
ncbi:DDE-type integrase/transposase/recombinase [Hymenobacter pini]|uniref:DDE-type integrase/transposase/recombinase n=1 Tax=Hymenobacter pini TaxID=2880879 RepID=UPI001CF3E00D|nr:DDE-type integrase/transposase/recombinase [Hymenobacter pini]